jgi:hypothetical protein
MTWQSSAVTAGNEPPRHYRNRWLALLPVVPTSDPALAATGVWPTLILDHTLQNGKHNSFPNRKKQ